MEVRDKNRKEREKKDQEGEKSRHSDYNRSPVVSGNKVQGGYHYLD